MNPSLATVILLATFAGRAAAQTPEFAAGRADYAAGEYRKAVAHFRLVLKDNPRDAEACYWTGMAYQSLADIATPFGGQNNSHARDYLTKAATLAPENREYRQALFDFLLDSSDSSRTALRQAADMLSAMPESDPDYFEMRRRLDDQRRVNSSAGVRLAGLVLIVPRAAYRAAALPASILPGGRGAASSTAEAR